MTHRYPERDVSASDDSKKLPKASRDDNIRHPHASLEVFHPAAMLTADRSFFCFFQLPYLGGVFGAGIGVNKFQDLAIVADRRSSITFSHTLGRALCTKRCPSDCRLSQR
jgi:hypothetical protein